MPDIDWGHAGVLWNSFLFSLFSSLRRSSLAPCVCAEMYISETSRHVFHSKKGSLHGGKWSGRLEEMVSYVCARVTRAWGEAEAVVETQLRDVHSVWLWSNVLWSHTNTYPLWLYTCPGCIIENGRQRTQHTRQRERDGGKPSCSLYHSFSSKMQNDNIRLSQHCSNLNSFPEWIVYTYRFWLCNAASATVGELCNSLGLGDTV